MAIEAAIWRDERRQKQALVTAWNTAALVRARRMPSLKLLLSSHSGPVTEEELRGLREKYRRLKKTIDANALAERAGLIRKNHGAW